MRTIVFTILFGCALHLEAARYSVQDLGLPSGYVFSKGTDLNDRGDVVGWVETKDNVSRGFVWSSGKMKLLNDDGWLESVASSINNKREVVGAFRIEGARHAFLYRSNRFDDLGQIDNFTRLGKPGNFVAGGSINDNSRIVTRLTIPDGNQRTAFWHAGDPAFFGVLDDGRICYGLAINNHDHIVGQVFDTNSYSRPFLWKDGEFVDLGSLGGKRASATEINDNGTVIGWALPTNAALREAHAFVWSEKDGIRDLGGLGGKTSRAYGLNNAGQIVGYSGTDSGGYAAFLYEDGQMTTLRDLLVGTRWKLITASAINNRGQIIASAIPPGGGQSRAVLLNPAELGRYVEATRPPLASTKLPDVGTVIPFNLSSFSRLDDGSFRLGFSGLVGAQYMIEVSTTLNTWERIGFAKRENGEFVFTDQNASRSKLCFYRAVLVLPPAGIIAR
tara:strand:+ start:2309 stop:3646 length:1338 start_codon:yes stop_codon:yes gene_type:complete